MTTHVAVLGGSFNPPTLAHGALRDELRLAGFEVKVVPCGARPDKPTTQHIDSVHRAYLIDLDFGGREGVEVLHFDLENDSFTPTVDLDVIMKRRCLEEYGASEVFHVVGTDLIQGGRHGKSDIQLKWKHGRRAWEELSFIVVDRPGYPVVAADLPPNCTYIQAKMPEISSTQVREAIAANRPINGLVSERVAEYIDRYCLYRGILLTKPPLITGLKPSIRIVVNENSPQACKIAEAFRPLEVKEGERARTILAIGGDGTMVKAVRDHWRERAEFCGLNAGTIGYLMHRPELLECPEDLLQQMEVFHLPMLHSEIEDADGQTHQILSVNDVWMERATNQTMKLRVEKDGELIFKLYMGDALIVATTTGSTAYSANAGGPEVPIGKPLLVLAGASPARWLNWGASIRSLDAEFEMTGIDTKWRPLRACADDMQIDRAVRLRTRVSHVASFQLAFLPGESARAKRDRDAFPDYVGNAGRR